MKKKNLILCIMTLLSSSLFAENVNKGGAAVAALNFRVMDIPLLDGMAYFISTIGTFGDIAGTLVSCDLCLECFPALVRYAAGSQGSC